MEKKWFVALLMVVVMMCACWTGAVAEDERDYQYALLDDCLLYTSDAADE